MVLDSILFGKQKCLLQSAMAFLKKHRVVWPGRQDTQAQLPKDGAEVRPPAAFSVARGQQRGPCRAREGRHHPVPCLKHILRPAGPKDLVALHLSQTGSGQVLAKQPKAGLGPSALAHSWLTFACTGQEPSNQPLESCFIFFF